MAIDVGLATVRIVWALSRVLTYRCRKLESAIDPATGLYDLAASRVLLERFVAEVKARSS